MPKPANAAADPGQKPRVLILACGALAKEILELNQANRWNAFDLHCIPAKYHNYPHRIPELVRAELRRFRKQYEKIFVAFGDCGTGGLLDRVLEEEQVQRLPGAHCYAFYAGLENFDAMHEQELGTLYLTDFFVRQFESILVKPFRLDNPQIKAMMFANYKRVMYLAQRPTPELEEKARQAAEFLGLDYEMTVTGYGQLASSLAVMVNDTHAQGAA